jgi:Flp pilus assembly protein TadD
MTLQLFFAFRRYRPVLQSMLLAGTLALFLPGCASQSLERVVPPPLSGAGPAIGIPDVDVLRISPAMEQFLERYVLQYNNHNTRRQLLALAVSDPSILGFFYNENRTFTAEEAFDTRSGNCIAFANLFVSLARRAGLDARYHEVLLPPEWSSHQDTIIVSKHVNVIINSPNGPYMIDVSGREIKADARRRIMADQEAKAMYFNNLAVEALFSDDLGKAHAYLVKAIETAPTTTDAWSNLGVVLGRNEQLEDAELAYRTALQLNRKELTAMGNLYELYIRQEKLPEALALKTRVENYRRENPYYLLALSDEAIAQQQFEESFDLLSRAIQKKEDEHLLHFAMARTQYLSGQQAAAQSSLNRARELAPQEVAEIYSRPLYELVQTAEQSRLQ